MEAKCMYREALSLTFNFANLGDCEDVRVRRAMSLAIDQDAILDAIWVEGFHAGPMHPGLPHLYIAPEDLADAGYPNAALMYTYDLEAAQALMADAGKSEGFPINLHYTTGTAEYADMCSLVVDYLGDINIDVTLVPAVHAQHWAKGFSRSYDGMFFQHTGSTDTYGSVTANYQTGMFYNVSGCSFPDWDEAWNEACTITDWEAHWDELRHLTYWPMDEHAIRIPMPSNYYYCYWWPWVKNYYGEQSGGYSAHQQILARIWLDQELKEQMGY
jgi:peptide/nickel transport system substrate-binding protein